MARDRSRTLPRLASNKDAFRISLRAREASGSSRRESGLQMRLLLFDQTRRAIAIEGRRERRFVRSFLGRSRTPRETRRSSAAARHCLISTYVCAIAEGEARWHAPHSDCCIARTKATRKADCKRRSNAHTFESGQRASLRAPRVCDLAACLRRIVRIVSVGRRRHVHESPQTTGVVMHRSTRTAPSALRRALYASAGGGPSRAPTARIFKILQDRLHH